MRIRHIKDYFQRRKAKPEEAPTQEAACFEILEGVVQDINDLRRSIEQDTCSNHRGMDHEKRLKTLEELNLKELRDDLWEIRRKVDALVDHLKVDLRKRAARYTPEKYIVYKRKKK